MSTNENTCSADVCKSTEPTHAAHSHCVQCGAEAGGWDAETSTWWCGRCAAAEDHKRLAQWFQENLGDEIKEGGLATNVIRLLSQRDEVPKLPWKKNGTTKFNIVCTMKDRWIPHFLAALKYMQHLGSIGGSRNVTLYADGDGDFNPRFSWSSELPSDAKPVKADNGNRTYDAG